jgi:hypothetical protein
MRQGIEIRLLMQPKETLIPHSLVLPTILSLSATSPVSKLKTAPGPLAIRSCTSLPL